MIFTFNNTFLAGRILPSCCCYESELVIMYYMHVYCCVFESLVFYTFELQPKQVELVEGYGVYLTRRQLDEAVDQSAGSPTKLIRNLLMIFFTPSVLAKSSCFGTGTFPKLNSDIIGACFRKQAKYL